MQLCSAHPPTSPRILIKDKPDQLKCLLRISEEEFMRRLASRLTMCGGVLLSVGGFGQQYASMVPAGSEVHVRVDQDINAKNGNLGPGAVFPGTVSRDVTDANGNVVIP